MIDFVRIPEERMRIFRKDKKLKEKLESFAGIKIELNDEISLEGDPLKIMRAKEVLKAFGRGFEFEDAISLLDEDYGLEIIDVKEFAGKSTSRLITLKGRIIGTGGKTKKMIEKYADVKIAIYGKTISIIGRIDRIMVAREAVNMLLSGSLHSTVYRFLERSR